MGGFVWFADIFLIQSQQQEINIFKYLGAVDGKHQWSDLKEGGFPALTWLP